jgi:hypothetical protein
MDADLYYQFMTHSEDEGDDLNGVFARIKAKMPFLRGEHVIVQQDGARAHTGRGNVEKFNELGREGGWHIEVVTQPAQSPDLNINDLGFFRSMKTRVEALKARNPTLDTMMEGVEQAWEAFDAQTLERIWAHQLECYRRILIQEGGNYYAAPHSDIGKRQLGGLQVLDYDVDRALVTQCRNMVNDYF